MSGKRYIKAITSYQVQRHTVRMASPRHILTLEAALSEDDKRHVFHLADKVRRCGNDMTADMMKVYWQLVDTEEYSGLMKAYGKAIEAEDAVLKKELGAKLKAMQEQHNVTWSFCWHKALEYARTYDIRTAFTLSRAEEIWSGMEKLLYSGGKKLHFKGKGDLSLIRGQTIRNGIAIHPNENGSLRFQLGKLHFTNIVKPEDKFINDETAAIWSYLQDPESNDRHAVEAYLRDGTLTDTYRPCYAALKCVKIKGKLRVYILVTVEGKPMRKYRKARDSNGNVLYDSNGEPIYVPRHTYGTGRVGVDIGTQTIAYTSKGEVNIKNLAERGDSIKHREAEERRLRRAMDRSMRAMNPDNYNPDGTVKKGMKTWIRSKRYMKLWGKLKELSRIAAENRHYAINEDVNHLRELGDELITESENADKVRRKAKPQTKEELADPHVKNRNRKRCGRSVQNRCPGYFQEKAKQVFASTGGRYVVVPAGFRASQYDHIADTYSKKPVSHRKRTLGDGSEVQRDMYSSFLLSNADDSYTSIDRDACMKNFQDFYRKEQARIMEIQKSGRKVMNSGIRTYRKSHTRKSA